MLYQREGSRERGFSSRGKLVAADVHASFGHTHPYRHLLDMPS